MSIQPCPGEGRSCLIQPGAGAQQFIAVSPAALTNRGSCFIYAYLVVVHTTCIVMAITDGHSSNCSVCGVSSKIHDTVGTAHVSEQPLGPLGGGKQF